MQHYVHLINTSTQLSIFRCATSAVIERASSHKHCVFMYVYICTPCMSHVTLVVRSVGSGVDIEEVHAVCRTGKNSCADVIVVSIVVYYRTKHHNLSCRDIRDFSQPDAEDDESTVWFICCFFIVKCCPCYQNAVMVNPFFFGFNRLPMIMMRFCVYVTRVLSY